MLTGTTRTLAGWPTPSWLPPYAPDIPLETAVGALDPQCHLALLKVLVDCYRAAGLTDVAVRTLPGVTMLLRRALWIVLAVVVVVAVILLAVLLLPGGGSGTGGGY